MDDQALADKLASLTGLPWELENTGGGCTALVLRLDDMQWGHYFMVTDDATVPAPTDPHHLGEYVNESQDINHWYFSDRRELVKFLKVWALKREGAI